MNRQTIGLMAVGLALGACADVQIWNATSHVDANWNTTSANWDDGAVWKNGNAAVFPAGGAPTAVTEEIRLSCLTNKATSNVKLQGLGRLVFESDSPGVRNASSELEFDCSVESDNQLEITGGYPTFLYGANLLPKGCAVTGDDTQIRINAAAALGTGPVVLGQNTAFWTTASGIEITNKIVQSGRAWGGALVGTAPTYRRIGTTDDNAEHVFGLGRGNGGKSSAILSLADDSEGIGCFDLRGNFTLTVNGGTVKARTDAATPFFRDWDKETHWNHQISVGRDGFTFDSNGAARDLSLGATLKFPETKEIFTNDVGECASAYANPYFESNSTGWTFGKLEGNKYDPIKRTNNGGSFCNKESHYTTNGTYFVGLRCYSYAASSISVPEAGLWRLACDIGNRPDSPYNGGWSIPVTVTVDEGTADEQSYVIPSRGSSKPFAYCATRPFVLKAGSHTVKYAAGNVTSGDARSSVHFDCFRLVRCEVVTNELATFVKKGVGTLVVDDLATDGRVVVSNGTLRLEQSDLVGTKLAVAANSTLDLRAGSLTKITMDVSAGATLRFSSDIVNCIENGSFESPEISDYVLMPNDSGWKQVKDSSNNTSGIQKNGGAMSANGQTPKTTDGDQTAYVRGNGGEIYRDFTVSADATYQVSFVQAPRDYSASYKATLEVLVDGDVLLTVDPHGSYHAFESHAFDVELTAGSHELRFRASGAGASGAMMLIDSVVVRQHYLPTAATTVVSGKINLASGSTLDLQDYTELVVPKGVVFVDGVAVEGGRRALIAAGVNVTGDGKVKIGDPRGMTILLR